MTLVQIRTFLTVAETGSVRAAAERLVVTESAVSSSVSALQRTLGFRLLTPDGRGIRITPAGQTYAAYARRALGLLGEARAAAAGDTDPGRGELRIAAITTVAEQILPRLLSRFRVRYPHVGAHLEVGNRERVRALLDNHEVDLIIGSTPQGGPRLPATTTHATRPYELVVVGPQSARAHQAEPWASRRSWLAEQTWLLREHGSGTRTLSHALLATLELAPRVLTLGSNGAVREAVVSDLGVSLISRDEITRELTAGELAEITTPATPLQREWCLASRRSRLPATAALFVRQLLVEGHFANPSDLTRDCSGPLRRQRDRADRSQHPATRLR
jgi:DNA-binding transcriptional LysR family regulator